MDEKETVQAVRDVQEPKKRRGGRKPFTPEQKAEAAKRREETRKLADNLIPEVVVQYQDSEANITALIDAAKAAFKAVKKRTRITDLKLYVKPEERAAYYVINGTFDGKVAY